jgi:iron complex outermembrane receptor protein
VPALAAQALAALLVGATPAPPAPAPAAAPALPSITVSARASPRAAAAPGSITVIESDEIARAGPGIDAGEALSRVPGVTVANRYNQAQDLQLSVRGYGARASFGIRGVRLSVNGIPASAPDGQGQLANAALAAADRIEVVRGPLAALYGNGGGAIKIDVDPAARPPGGRVHAAAQADFRQAGATLRGGRDTTGYVVDVGRFETDGFRPQSAARRDLVDVVARWNPSPGWRLDATLNGLDAPRAEDPLGLTPTQFDDDPDGTAAAALAFDTRKSTRQVQGGIALSADDDRDAGARLAAYGGHREIVQFLAVPVAAQASPTSGGGVVDLARGYGGVEARVWRTMAFGGGPLRLGAGLDLERLDEDRRGYENFVGATLGVRGRLRRAEDNRIDRTDLLLQAEWSPAPDWVAVAGLRHNRVRFTSDDGFVAAGNPDDSGRRRFTADVPALALRWAPDASWSLHAAIARGFETPTANELAYRDDGSAGFNLDLRPSRSVQRELGARWTGAADRVALALFDDDSRDEIVVARAQGGRSAFRNAGRVQRRGVELDWQRELAPDWTFVLAATWLDARFVDPVPPCAQAPCPPGAQPITAGARLPAVPARSGFAALRWEPAGDWSAELSLRGVGARWADDANRLRAPGHAAASLDLARRWSWHNRSMHVRMRLDNLAGRRFVSSLIVNDANGRVFEPAPGRTAWVQVGLDW